MWRSDDASRRFSTSAIGDDTSSCDELANTKLGESPIVMRNRTVRSRAETTRKMSETKDRTGPPLWVGFTAA